MTRYDEEDEDELSEDEIEEMLGELRTELAEMSVYERRIVRRSRESFLRWLYDAIGRIASYIGELVSSPLKALLRFIAGLFDGFFRG